MWPAVPGWDIHWPAGERMVAWSPSVPRNRRTALRTDQTGGTIVDLNCENFHREPTMSISPSIRMKSPAHPGGFVKSEVIEPLGLTTTAAARALGVTRPTLSALLNERAGLTPEMALRIEKVFGVSMDTLLRMQTSYDIAQTRSRHGDLGLVPFPQQVA